MVSVAFAKLFVHERSNFDEYESFDVADGSETYAAPGVQRRMNAAGVTRIVTTPGRTVDLPYYLVDVTRTQLEWLRERAGEQLLFRDPRGRLAEGVYLDLRVVELAGAGATVDVELTVTAVSSDLSNVV